MVDALSRVGAVQALSVFLLVSIVLVLPPSRLSPSPFLVALPGRPSWSLPGRFLVFFCPSRRPRKISLTGRDARTGDPGKGEYEAETGKRPCWQRQASFHLPSSVLFAVFLSLFLSFLKSLKASLLIVLLSCACNAVVRYRNKPPSLRVSLVNPKHPRPFQKPSTGSVEPFFPFLVLARKKTKS